MAVLIHQRHFPFVGAQSFLIFNHEVKGPIIVQVWPKKKTKPSSSKLNLSASLGFPNPVACPKFCQLEFANRASRDAPTRVTHPPGRVSTLLSGDFII